MGDLQDAVKKLEINLEAIKQEAIVTPFPNIVRAGIESAITILSHTVALSKMRQIEGEDKP